MRKALYILGQLTDEDVDWLFQVGQKRKLVAGEELIMIGKPIQALFVVLDGSLHVLGPTGRAINQLEWGEVVGEMSFIDSNLPSATVRAGSNSVVLAIDKRLLTARLGSDTAFAARFYLALAMFLSAKMRGSIGSLGYGDAPSPSVGVDVGADLLDDNVLDSVYLAGLRFERLTKQVLQQK